jgi:hypothetical protein
MGYLFITSGSFCLAQHFPRPFVFALACAAQAAHMAAPHPAQRGAYCSVGLAQLMQASCLCGILLADPRYYDQ